MSRSTPARSMHVTRKVMRSSGVSPGTEPRCACWSHIRRVPPNSESPRNSQALAWASATAEPAQRLFSTVRRFGNRVLRLVPDVMTEIAVQGRLAQLVAINAGDHGDFLFLPENIPVLHRTVAHRAGRVGIDVLLVIEENKVWQGVHWAPRNEVVISLDLGELLDGWAIGLDTLMASHTIRHSRDLHLTVGSRRW